MSKNPAAQELGRRGGEARAEKLSEDERSAIAKLGAQAMWEKERKRRAGEPTLYEVVKRMLAEIEKTGKAHSLFVEDRKGRFCPTDSDMCKLWRSTKPECWVGNYSPGTTYTEVINDFVAT